MKKPVSPDNTMRYSPSDGEMRRDYVSQLVYISGDRSSLYTPIVCR